MITLQWASIEIEAYNTSDLSPEDAEAARITGG